MDSLADWPPKKKTKLKLTLKNNTFFNVLVHPPHSRTLFYKIDGQKYKSFFNYPSLIFFQFQNSSSLYAFEYIEPISNNFKLGKLPFPNMSEDGYCCVNVGPLLGRYYPDLVFAQFLIDDLVSAFFLKAFNLDHGNEQFIISNRIENGDAQDIFKIMTKKIISSKEIFGNQDLLWIKR